MKQCNICNGQGFEQEDLDAIKETCTKCNGSGEVELSEDEITMEHECKLIDNGLKKFI